MFSKKVSRGGRPTPVPMALSSGRARATIGLCRRDARSDGGGHMTSSSWRFGFTLAFLGFASILPATVEAQPPVYLTQWGSEGSGDGQFSFPRGVATDGAGNIYVYDAETDNNRIQKFTSTGT